LYIISTKICYNLLSFIIINSDNAHLPVRLIQLFQNGKKPIDLALNIADGEPPMRPPFFEGVNVQAIMQQQQGSGASVAPRPPMQQQLSSQQLGGPPPQQVVQQPTPQGSPQRSPQLNGMSTQQPPAMSQPATMNGAAPTMSPANTNQQQQLAIQDPYTMTPQELARYEQLFPTYAVQEADGMYYVHGGAAVELFSKSGKFCLDFVFDMCLCIYIDMCIFIGDLYVLN